ncbi:MAG: T9SS type A sorting domain-containing protein [Bacteroidales bacterium]|nr:T9SS type A sorting domain-containing protein [Bacteroidales bacterium]
MKEKQKKRLWLAFIPMLVLNLILKGNTEYKPAVYPEHETDTPDFCMTGYATVEAEGLLTTTGGEGGTTDTVSTLDELQAFAKSREKNTSPGILYIKGKIESQESLTVSIKHGANVSVIGLGSDAELKNVGLNIWDYTNVIVRNLTIHEVLYPDDAITIDECHHVWIDHCELYSKIGEGIDVDTYDGLLDIKNGSRYVTLSWNYLHDHMKCSLIGHSDGSSHEATDSQFRITFHHNYFRFTDGRNPSLRFGALHMFNNYLENITDYGIAIRQAGHAKLENNHFESVNIPVTTNKFDGPEGYACLSGNIYTGTCSADDNSITQTDCDFWNDLPYSYTLDSANHVAMLAKLFAGAGVLDTIKAAGPDTNGITVGEKEIIVPVSTRKFSVSLPYPNPVHSMFNIDIFVPGTGLVDMLVTDISGLFLQSLPPVMLSEGKNTIQITRGNLKAGMYFYVFEFHGNKFLRKVVVID